jgi:hypothetical protein
MSDVETLSEKQLTDYLSHQVVKQLRLVEDENGNWLTYVTLTWKEGELQLTTRRKHQRLWVSLDRLIRHIKSKQGPPPPLIVLELRSNNDPKHRNKNPTK